MIFSMDARTWTINPVWTSFKNIRNILKKDELGVEIAQIAMPAALALAADPIASLFDTAFIGHIGAVELAAVGVAIAIFNQATKLAVFPLVSTTTSLVAEEEVTRKQIGEVEEEIEIVECSLVPEDEEKKALLSKLDVTRKQSGEEEVLLSKFEDRSNSPRHGNSKFKMVAGKQCSRHNTVASSALVIGGMLGIFQAIFLIFTSKPLLKCMGVISDSPMMNLAEKYLTVRSLGSPAVLLSMALQGVFRGLKDTHTPLYASVIGDATNIMLDPIFIFIFGLGVTGAAIAHVFSQYLIASILIWKLSDQVDLLPSSIKHLQFNRFLKIGVLVLIKVIASTSCVTLAASLAARLGTTSMAAFQICLQVWLASSLLADGLAISAQALLASAFAKNDYERATATASRVLQLGLVLGLILSVIVAVILRFASVLFTKDVNVLHLLRLGIPFVVATQPVNSMAFVFDGVNYGASDFAYSSYSTVFVAGLSILSLVLLGSCYGFVGIWVALTIFMTSRALAGLCRIGTRTGPWNYLRG